MVFDRIAKCENKTNKHSKSYLTGAILQFGLRANLICSRRMDNPDLVLKSSHKNLRQLEHEECAPPYCIQCRLTKKIEPSYSYKTKLIKWIQVDCFMILYDPLVLFFVCLVIKQHINTSGWKLHRVNVYRHVDEWIIEIGTSFRVIAAECSSLSSVEDHFKLWICFWRERSHRDVFNAVDQTVGNGTPPASFNGREYVIGRNRVGVSFVAG